MASWASWLKTQAEAAVSCVSFCYINKKDQKGGGTLGPSKTHYRVRIVFLFHSTVAGCFFSDIGGQAVTWHGCLLHNWYQSLVVLLGS
jgi:hypothetical protein